MMRDQMTPQLTAAGDAGEKSSEELFMLDTDSKSAEGADTYAARAPLRLLLRASTVREVKRTGNRGGPGNRIALEKRPEIEAPAENRLFRSGEEEEEAAKDWIIAAIESQRTK